MSTGGIVTAIFDGNEPFTGAGFNANLGGFYIQTSKGDGNMATSDGIFVKGSVPSLAVGDSVTLDAIIKETFEQTTLTEISNAVIVSSSNTLPTSVMVNLPLSNLSDYEQWEGMLVSFSDQLTVSESRNVDNFGELRLSQGGRLVQPSQVIDANDADPEGNATSGGSNEPALAAATAQIAQRTIILDDARQGSDLTPVPYLDGDNHLTLGTTVDNLTGILSYGFGSYRLQPTAPPAFNYAPRPMNAPAVGDKARLKVVAFNVLNYFNGDGQGGGFPTSRGASTPERFANQRSKIIAALSALDGDVVGLMEIENDGGELSALNDLVAGLNAEMGEGTYAAVNTGIIAPATADADQIKVAMIYKPTAVSLKGDFAILNNAFSADYNDDKNRPALAQTFMEKGTSEVFTVVVNHLKSKGSGCGTGDDNTYQGNCNGTRTQAAIVQTEWIESDPTSSEDPDFLVIGDINAYAQEDPIDAFRAAGFESTKSDDVYTYVFNGQAGSLDHILASRFMSPQVTGSGVWHINADEPEYFQYDGDESLFEANPFRSSDHDPVIVGLRLDSENVPPPAGQGQGSLVVQVSSSTDDAEELSSTEVSDFGAPGDLDLGSSDLELVDDTSFNGTGQTVGIRFSNITIPKGAIILDAYMEFSKDDANDGETIIQFRVQADDNALTFANTPNNISSRSVSTDFVEWNIPEFTAESVGSSISTPKLTSLVQQVVNREGWADGNALAFIITGSGEREVTTFDKDPAKAPKLIIDYLPVNGFMTQVASSLDDAEEATDSKTNDAIEVGGLDFTSSDLELVDDGFNGIGQTVGIRFTGIDVPAGAKIESAYLVFNQEDLNDGETIVNFGTEAIDNSPGFLNVPFNLSSRTLNGSSVEWNIPAFAETGDFYHDS